MEGDWIPKRPRKLDVSYPKAGEAVSPVGTRYTTPMARIFGESHYIQSILDVEAENVKALSELYPGKVPPRAAKKIKSIANTKHVTTQSIRKTEATRTHHEMGAVVIEMAKKAGKDGRYVHFAMTSADAVETAKAMQIAEAMDLLMATVASARDSCMKAALKWKRTTAIVRTHGQHAIPASFGLPFAFFGYCLGKNLERLRYDRERYIEGKLSGAIGTYDVHTNEGIDGMAVERLVLGRLGVRVPGMVMQIPARENIAYIMSDLAVLCGRLEAMAEYIKTLKRTEILEIAELPDEGTVGSSAMPHKSVYGNPFIEERCISIARTVRGQALSALESMLQEDFRDLTASLSDRVGVPESFILSDYSCRLMQNVVERISPVQENIRRNMDISKGAIASQLVMSRLIKKGMSREAARNAAIRGVIKAARGGAGYIDALLKDKEISGLLSAKEISELTDPDSSIGRSRQIVRRIAGRRRP